MTNELSHQRPSKLTPPPIRYGYADTVLGQLHYAEAGAGHPVILLHQTPRSLDEFSELMPLLASSNRVIAMDMYGFGQSAKPPAGSQSIEQYASGVIALADTLRLDSFAVLGHHTGAFVAIEVSATLGRRVSALVVSSGQLVDAQFRAAHSQPPRVDNVQRSRDGVHLQELWDAREALYPRERIDLLDRFMRDALAPGVNPLEGHLACSRYVMEDRVGLVHSPVLVVGASNDPVSFPDTGRVAAAFTATSVEVHIIEGGMIPLMEQKPEEVAAAVGAFLHHVHSRRSGV